MHSPVEIRFYSLLGEESSPDSLRAFSGRVDQLLSGYEREAGGKITVTSFNSRSDENLDAAASDGLRVFNLDKGEPSYLGLSVAREDQKESLPRIAPEWEQALEADLTRAILRVSGAESLAERDGATTQAASDATAEVKRAIPNFDSIPVDQARQILRDAAFKDVQRAVSVVRSRAAEWKIDPKRIGILGFSAGGHLAARACTNFKKRSYDPVDKHDQAACRPDFAVLIYPAYLGTAALDRATLPVATDTPSTFIAIAFDDKFTTGEVIKTDNTYQSEDISVTVTKVEEDSATYYIADIYVRNIDNFKTLFAQDTYGTGFSEKTEDMATRTNAIIAVSGDNYGGRNFGVVIRNGELFRDSLFEDVLIMNNDGSMETFSPEAFDINSVLQNGAWQGWSFGPLLLTDGQPMIKGTFNSSVNPRNPGSAIGYFEPGHYCFILVDGRQPGYSDGLTLEALSQVFYDLGCTVAYNLDGGQTAVMAFMGAETNIPYEGGRKTSDILYIAENEG